jgi:2-C-methyl-D-erythritol 4-phosphate cytidylyltransferase/2-C-methyl-D-erythritol 2,4-cyclodiphosphate synthase
MSETVALIVAAGGGERMGGGMPKQYRPLGGRPVLRWVFDAFRCHPKIMDVRVVMRPSDLHLYRAAVAGFDNVVPVVGAQTRQGSVRNGLEALALDQDPPQAVLIHDAARPLVSSELISRVIAGLDRAEAVYPELPLNDTLRRKSPGGKSELIARDNLGRAQTPQGFIFGAILEAHRRFKREKVTDDIALAEMAGMSVASVEGEEMNIKLTTADDFVTAERLALGSLLDVRTGSGFDAHRFGAGNHVSLCGVKIPHDYALVGHSDADVGLHALTDALLGALGAADIGAHFPPSDERWRGASSHLFLDHAAQLVRQRGGAISHVDVTLICERPKLAPHRDAMRARIASILQIDIGRVSVKATTSDGLGFTGRGEGIAAQAVATLRLPA